MSRRYYHPEIETMPVEEIRRMQSEKLVRQVGYAYDRLPYYRALLDRKGVSPRDIRGIEDVSRLPLLSKSDLIDQYPDGLCAAPRSACVRVHATSGTTGRKVLAFYTQRDIDLWEDCCARALTAAGVSEEDVCQIAYGYGLFTGGAGLHGASQRLGCLTVPMSSGNTERQIQFMRDLGSTVLCCTPSYAAYLAEALREHGYGPKDQSLRIGVFGAESWTEGMRRNIEEALGIRAYDIYGLTEISGPGVAFECEEQNGLHINEDHFLAEIVDPDTGEPLPPGREGELALTCLDKEAFPLIRYRTRDLCTLIRDACPCGRTFLRMSKPMGRSDDMIIVRGVNVFPSQIEAVLLSEGYPPHYRIEVDRAGGSDTLDVYAELREGQFSDTVRSVTEAENALAAAIRQTLGVRPAVHLTPPKTIARSEGKTARVVDKRRLQG